MADAKKTDKKKEAPSSKSGHDMIWELVGFFLALMIFVSATANFSIFGFLGSSSSGSNSNSNSNSNSVSSISGDYGFWESLFKGVDGGAYPSAGDLSSGKDVISKGLIQVRREPGGSVIGLQKRGTMSKIVDGPISAYGARWWMVDFKEPPSGWVDEKDITTKFFSYYVANFFPILWDYIKILSWILSVFFGLGIIYIAFKELSVPTYDNEPAGKKKEDEAVYKTAHVATTEAAPSNLPMGGYSEQNEENLKWKHIELLLKSHNSSDWRQSIIEADVMLEDMLEKMGYPGVSIGDKLKNVESGDFQTLDKAWEAHKVRNRIAHDGSAHKFPYDEAVRVIGLYHDVFKEFYWI